MSDTERIHFIDWLKALGMLVILLGHLAGAYTNLLAPPIYPKQLGVAFFVFVTGYSLAIDRRPSREVLFNRLFEVVLWGLSMAAVVSIATYLRRGSLAASNFLPFAFGANVFVNNFPDNPTTWYIGTYIHLLMLWCVIRDRRISSGAIVVIFVSEIACRAFVASTGNLFIAYMALPNWATVWAMGVRTGQVAGARTTASSRADRLSAACVLATAVAAVLWYAAVWPLISERTFPFMRVTAGSPLTGLFLTSLLVSCLYAGWTAATYFTLRDVRAPAPVRFVARNTLIIFIVHMPVFYVLDGPLRAGGWSYPARSALYLTTSLILLPALSELLHRHLPLREWRARIFGLLPARLATDEVGA